MGGEQGAAGSWGCGVVVGAGTPPVPGSQPGDTAGSLPTTSTGDLPALAASTPAVVPGTHGGGVCGLGLCVMSSTCPGGQVATRCHMGHRHNMLQQLAAGSHMNHHRTTYGHGAYSAWGTTTGLGCTPPPPADPTSPWKWRSVAGWAATRSRIHPPRAATPQGPLSPTGCHGLALEGADT
jgi:hypothetical protein